ncbi:MAG: hypothetical protein IE931_14560 [Sphingobacteriales bacterium]|nr:hypothetical protein [Sphingobacteriales bacterium]
MDSIETKDTLFLEIKIPFVLKDMNTNALIDYSESLNLGTTVSIDSLTGGSINIPGTAPAANSFNYLVFQGKKIENKVFPERMTEYLFDKDMYNSQYVFKLGIIPNKRGVFIIGVGNASGVYRKSDKCTKASYSINFHDTNQHLYYYQQNRPGYIIEGLEKTNSYCFKVY